MARSAVPFRVLLVTSFLLPFALAQQPGVVGGVVIDEKGSPVAEAIASVEPLGMQMGTAIPQAEADKEGRFLIEHLALASYKVFAKKVSADYRDTSFAFYSNHSFSTVTLTASAPSADVILKIGPPAGILQGSVTDAATK